MVAGVLTTMLPSEVWAASGVLFKQAPTMATTAPPVLHLGALCPLSIPRLSLFPVSGHPRSNAMLLLGVTRARVFIWLGLANKVKQQPQG